MKLLIVEDDDIMRNMIKKGLNSKLYEIMDTAKSVEALEIIKKESPDIIILDIVLPEIDGFSTCQIIRKYPEKYGNPFILMLTSKSEEKDVVRGLNCGADDYLKKPFGLQELKARIESVIRRKEREKAGACTYKNLIVDIDKKLVFDSSTGEGIELFRKEFELLVYFIQNKGIVMTREYVYESIWGSEYIQGDRAIDNYVWKLKSKIPVLEESLKSIRGMGYKLEK